MEEAVDPYPETGCEWGADGCGHFSTVLLEGFLYRTIIVADETKQLSKATKIQKTEKIS